MLNPRFYKNNVGNWTLEWDSDPQAVAYDIVLPDGSHIQYRMSYGETGKFDSSLLNPDGTKRPAWEALRQAMALA